VRIRDLVGYFLRLGALGFGGPVALCGQMARELVEERCWVATCRRRARLPLVSIPVRMCYIKHMRAHKPSSASKTMTLRLDPGTLRRLDELAQATDRSRAWLAAQAVRTYLKLNEWQIKAIREAVERADRRDTKFLTHDEVDVWLATWGTSQERKPPL